MAEVLLSKSVVTQGVDLHPAQARDVESLEGLASPMIATCRHGVTPSDRSRMIPLIVRSDKPTDWAERTKRTWSIAPVG
jgi:hypothetical protein